jgi:hypothetical protein
MNHGDETRAHSRGDPARGVRANGKEDLADQGYTAG